MDPQKAYLKKQIPTSSKEKQLWRVSEKGGVE